MSDTLKKWVNTWEKADKALREIKRQELQNYDYEKNRQLIDEMLQWACEHSEVRLTSGLVEQQRIFMKWRDK